MQMILVNHTRFFMRPFLSTIVFLTLINSFFYHSTYARIRNGYEPQLQTARISYDALTLLANDPGASPKEKRRVNEQLRHLKEFLAAHEATEKVVRQLQQISPSIYLQMDTLVDCNGRAVDIYIKCVRSFSTKARAAGITFIAQSLRKDGTYLSEYGEATVSVKIWIVENAVFILAHELGHVSYQVKNLLSYISFHKQTYRNLDLNEYIGHHPRDPSGMASTAMEERFESDYRNFIKAGGKLENIAADYFEIRKGM
jgi:hypothetical protein